MTPNILTVKSLSRRFGYRTILRHVDLSVGEGEVVVIQGANGSGKTTLLRILSTLLPATSGEVNYFGKHSPQDRAALRPRLGVLLAEVGLDRDISAIENLRLFAHLYRLPNPEATVTTWIQKLKIEARTHALVRTLSKGERQRVGIARSLLHNPSLVFWDEPSSGLDEAGQQLIRDLIDELRSSTTFVLASHDPTSLLPRNARLVQLYQGTLK